MMNTQFTHQKLEYLIIAVIALFLAVFPVCVLADTVVITNSVKASASSGGNTVSGNGGQIITGETEVDIFIETVVNGETVEHIDEHYEGSDIPDGGIHKETHYESEDKSVVIDTNVAINAGAGQEKSEEDSLNQKVGENNETATVLNSINKEKEDFENNESLIDVAEKEPVNNIKVENTKENKKVGVVSFISNKIANLFKYVLSIFA